MPEGGALDTARNWSHTSPVRQNFFVAAATSFLLAAAPGMCAAGQANPEDRLDYGGVIVEPGDVISFLGGDATVRGRLLTHGHASMYLGFDPQTRQQMFLDFSTTKDGIPEFEYSSSMTGFHGRLMPEREFLTYNARYHPSFDVYRLEDRTTLDERRLLREAKLIATSRRFGLSLTVCSSAVSEVLSAATGRRIGVITPDGFQSAPFIKHPQQGNDPIDINGVLRQLGRISGETPTSGSRVSDFLSRVARQAAAGGVAQRNTEAQESEIRTPDTSAEDGAREARRAAAWQYLKATMQLACTDPDNLRSLREARRTWGVLISRAVVENLFTRERDSMSQCARNLMTGVLSGAGPVDVKWLETEGRRHYEAEQRRVRREQEAAARAARAAESARTEYDAAETRLSSSGRASAEIGDPTLGSAYRHLTGIAGGNVGIFDGR